VIAIRSDQLDAFLLLHDDEGLVAVVAAHLRRESRPLVERIPPGLLDEMIRGGLARARRHGLAAASDLAAFVSLMFEIAPNFDEHPAIRRSFDEHRGEREGRVPRLLAAVPDEAWREAEERYDAAAWFEGRSDGRTG
jgi:hypothetical protein